jgi:hypothetical protein
MRTVFPNIFAALAILQAGLALSSCKSEHPLKSSYPNEVTVVNSDTVETFMLAKTGDIETDPDKLYYFYTRNQIGQAKGGLLGKPLDGSYVASTRANILIERGEFVNGLKNGEWVRWSGNGSIAQRLNYRDGLRHGKFSDYYVDGKLKTSGRYRNDVLNGTISYFDPYGKETKSTFVDGVEKIAKTADTTRVKSPARAKQKRRSSKESQLIDKPVEISSPENKLENAPTKEAEGKVKKERASKTKETHSPTEKSTEKSKRKKSLTNPPPAL